MESNKQQVSIALDNGLVLNQCNAITWADIE